MVNQNNEVVCKYCGSSATVKFGKYKGIQRYFCKICKRKFVDNGAITKMKTPASQIASAMGMYYGGMPLDSIQRQFIQDHKNNMSESNFWNWVKRFTTEAIEQSKDFKPEVGDTWVADETYLKLGKKDIYFWDIIDSKTRYLLATHVSTTRTSKDARELMELAKQRAGKTPRMVITDKLRAYISGIEDVFGADTRHKQGGPFDIESNTNLIERFHETLKMRTRVFKKFRNIEDIRLLTDGWLIYYNFFKQNEGVGDIPPAQALSQTVPFKDWNDVVRNELIVPEVSYRVKTIVRPSRYNPKRKNKPRRKVDVVLTMVRK